MKQLSLLEEARDRYPDATDDERIEAISAETISELGLEPPIDLEIVASYHGISEIRVVDPLPVAGVLSPIDDRLVVQLRRGDSRRRRRFTGFHEVGHVFQPGFRLVRHFRCTSPGTHRSGSADQEALADSAAAGLLFPREYFESDAHASRFGLSSILKLADVYDASVVATAYSYLRYRSEPSLMLVLEPGFRKAELRSEGAEPRLRVVSSWRQGPWPFIPKNKSAIDGGALARALKGEVVLGERGSVRIGAGWHPANLNSQLSFFHSAMTAEKSRSALLRCSVGSDNDRRRLVPPARQPRQARGQRVASIGQTIKAKREKADLSLSALAAKAEVSKGYLWSLEKGETDARPSGQTLYRIADALGTTMSDLLGRELLIDSLRPVPKSLKKFADNEGLSDSDVQMLAQVNFRGQQPDDVESWGLIWQAVRHSVRHGRRKS